MARQRLELNRASRVQIEQHGGTWGHVCGVSSQSIIQRLCRESSIVGSHIDKLREREDDGGKCQFILTLDITTVKWES